MLVIPKLYIVDQNKLENKQANKQNKQSYFYIFGHCLFFPSQAVNARLKQNKTMS